MKSSIKTSLIAVVAVLTAGSAAAQVVLSGNSYVQAFDNLAVGLPAGWSVRTNATLVDPGIAAPLVNSATSWSATAGQFANFASTSNNDGTPFDGSELSATQNAATNRCLGMRQTGSFGDPGAAFVFQIQSTLGFADFHLTLEGNLLYESGRSTTWTVDYAIGASPAGFTALTTFADPGTFGAMTRSVSFGSALNNLAAPVWIRVVALSASTGSGSRDAFGIDNFALTWSPYALNTNPPSVLAQPQNRNCAAGTDANFNVSAAGEPPLFYQWRKGGAELADGNGIAGSSTPSLTVSNVLAADAGLYSVVVSNAYGFTLSSNATLAVVDPVITQSPASRTNLAGDIASFSVSATGTGPIKYQWLCQGTNLAGATAATLNVANVQATNAGDYSVIISNALGQTAVSAPATLTLLTTPPVRLARWNFNATNSFLPTAPAPSGGSGTASLTGAATASFSAGTISDPAGTPGRTNSGWNTTGYPSKSASNKTAGVEFHVSTVGYANILLAWEQRHSDSASKYARLQYSADSTNFTDADVIVMSATDNSYAFYSSDLSAVAAINNNPNFAFRIVTEFESTALGTTNANYVPTAPDGTYRTDGSIRFDLVSVYSSSLGAAAPIELHIHPEAGAVVVSWSDSAYSLQAAPNAEGNFTNVPGATSPYTNPITSSQKFFRLRAP